MAKPPGKGNSTGRNNVGKFHKHTLKLKPPFHSSDFLPSLFISAFQKQGKKPRSHDVLVLRSRISILTTPVSIFFLLVFVFLGKGVSSDLQAMHGTNKVP